jgi:hypothetical protein
MLNRLEIQSFEDYRKETLSRGLFSSAIFNRKMIWEVMIIDGKVGRNRQDHF